MTVRVGVIGVGMIGQDHIRRLRHVLAGAAIVAVSDVDEARARSVAEDVGARVHGTGQDLIGDPEVDGVIVASWGPTHEAYVVAAIEAGKPVFCEKPLAPTEAECGRILDAEVKAGRRLVMVGFMRRYDQAYRALKRVATDGSIGAPLLMHCAHRNPSVPPHFTADMIVNDSAIHEFDLVRWLFEEEIAAVSVLRPRRNSRAEGDLADPLVVLLEMASGVLVDVELSVNIAYGYDIRGEIVAETGTAALPDGADVVVKREGYRASPVPADWRERFLRAYDVELQEWVDAVAAGEATGPSAWDGYAATVVAEHGLEALHSGARVPVVLRDKPEFYSK